MFALNQGEVCTCPSRALIQESIYDQFMERALKRVEAIVQGSPLDMATMIGAQASQEQQEKILRYIGIGRDEGAEVLIGGEAGSWVAIWPVAITKPTVFKGHNKMRIFQEEIFGPVVSTTTFKTPEEALAIANDTMFGLPPACGAETSTPAIALAAPFRRAAWTNCYHAYPAHAAFAATSSRALVAKPTG
jgi:aldehyde dehydrogenase